jgi:hypothetical protein
MDEGGWFGWLRGKQDPYVKFEAFNEIKKTTVKNNAGKEAKWNECFDFPYDTVLQNLDQDYKITALDKDLGKKDDVIGTSNNFKVSQLLIVLGEEPITKRFYLYNEKEVRSVGYISVKMSWIRKIGDQQIVGVSLDIPLCDQEIA